MQLTIVTIGTFVAILNQGTKYVANNFIKKDVSRFIPVCSVIYGIILGIIGFFLPNADMGSNIVEAIFIGISAGSTSTCCHQMYKQAKKKTTSLKTVDTTTDEIVTSETDDVSPDIIDPYEM